MTTLTILACLLAFTMLTIIGIGAGLFTVLGAIAVDLLPLILILVLVIKIIKRNKD